jgi:hypothetical protein
MTRFLVTMGGSDYEPHVARTVQDAPRFGVDKVRVYDDVWLKAHPFYEINKWLWDLPESIGFGWHAWKPLLILDTLEIAKEGDVVLYVDGDTYPLRDLGPLYEKCQRDGAVFFDVQGHGGHIRWCTRDCFIVMGQDEEKYWNAVAGCARFLLIKKGDYRAMQLLQEWQTWCLHPLANTRIPSRPKSILGQDFPELVEHRTDQAILTNLAHKYGYELQQEASQGGPAPQYFEQIHCTHNSNPGTGSRFRNV